MASTWCECCGSAYASESNGPGVALCVGCRAAFPGCNCQDESAQPARAAEATKTKREPPRVSSWKKPTDYQRRCFLVLAALHRERDDESRWTSASEIASRLDPPGNPSSAGRALSALATRGGPVVSMPLGVDLYSAWTGYALTARAFQTDEVRAWLVEIGGAEDPAQSVSSRGPGGNLKT